MSETPIIASNGEEPTPVTADGNLNYTWQWRDRFGRWIEMGRGIKFKLRLKSGGNVSVIGKFVGSGSKPGVGYVHVKGDPNLPDGFYEVKSGNAQEILTSLDPEYLAKRGIQLGKDIKGETVAERSDVDIDNADTIVRLDAPPGWKKNRDGSYVSEDGVYQMTQNSDGSWRVTRARGVVVQEPTPDETEGRGDVAVQKQGRPGLMAQEQELIGDFSNEAEGFKAVSDLRLEGRLSPAAKRQVDDLRKELNDKKERIAILTDPEGVRGQRVQKNIDDLNDKIQAILRPTVEEPEKAPTASKRRTPFDDYPAGTVVSQRTTGFMGGKSRIDTYIKNEDGTWTNREDGSKLPWLDEGSPDFGRQFGKVQTEEPKLVSSPESPESIQAKRLAESLGEKPLSEQVKERTQPKESADKTLNDIDPEFLAGFVSKVNRFNDNPNAWGAVRPFDPDKAQIFAVEDATGVQAVWWTPDGVSLWNYDESTEMIFQQVPKEDGKSAEDLFVDNGWRANAVRKGKNLVFLTKEDSNKVLGLGQVSDEKEDKSLNEQGEKSLADRINEAIDKRDNLLEQIDAATDPEEIARLQKELGKAESDVSKVANEMDNAYRQKPEPSAVEESKGATEKSGFGEDYDFVNSPEYLDAVEKFKQDALARAEGMSPIERRKAAREARKLNREQDIQAKRDRAAQNNVDREQQLLDFAKSKAEYEAFKKASRDDNLSPEQYEAGDWMSENQTDFWANATPGTKVEVDFDLNDPSIDGEQSGTLTRDKDGLWHVDAGDLEANFENRYGKLAFTTDELKDLMAPYGNEEGLYLAPGQVITPSGPPPQSEKKTTDISPTKIHAELNDINKKLVELDQKQLDGDISPEDAAKERTRLLFFREVLRNMDEQVGGAQFIDAPEGTVVPEAERQDLVSRIDAELARLDKIHNPSVNDLTDLIGQRMGELEGDKKDILAGKQMMRDNVDALRALPTPEESKQNEDFIFSLADRGVVVPEDEKQDILDRIDGEIARLGQALNDEVDQSFTGNPYQAMEGRFLDLKMNRQFIADGKKVDARFLEEARKFRKDSVRFQNLTPEEVVKTLDLNTDNATEIDINGDIRAQVEAAISDGKMVKFMYWNEKDQIDKLRLVKPKYIWTNPNNGKTHLRATDSDGVDKNFELIEMKAIPAENESDVPTPLDTADPETTEVPNSEAEVARIIRMLDLLEHRNQILVDAVLKGEWDTEEAEQISSANEKLQKTLLAELDQLNAGDKEKMVSQVKQMIKLVEDRMIDIEDGLAAGNLSFDGADSLYKSNLRMLNNLNEQLAKLEGGPEATAKPETPKPGTMDVYNQQLEDIRRRRDELDQAARNGEVPLVRAQGIRNGLDAEERQIREARNRGAGMEANRGDLFRAPVSAENGEKSSSKSSELMDSIKSKLNELREKYRSRWSGEPRSGVDPAGFEALSKQGVQARVGVIPLDNNGTEQAFGKIYKDEFGLPQDRDGHLYDGIAKEILAPMLAKLLGIEEAILVADGREFHHNLLLGEFAAGRMAGDVVGAAQAENPAIIRRYKNADLIGLLDVLLVNEDRHHNNWMINGDVIEPIDHGGVNFRRIEDVLGPDRFGNRGEIRWRNPFWMSVFQERRWNGEPVLNPVFSKQELLEMKNNLEAAREIFVEQDREEYFDAVMSNMDKIIEAARYTAKLDDAGARNLEIDDEITIIDPNTGNRTLFKVKAKNDTNYVLVDVSTGTALNISKDELAQRTVDGLVAKFYPAGVNPEALPEPESPPAGLVIPERNPESIAQLEALRDRLMAGDENLAVNRDRQLGGGIVAAPYGDGVEYTRNGVIHGRIIPDTMVPQFRPGYKAVYKPGTSDEAHAYFDNRADAEKYLGTVIGMIEDLPENPINREMIDFDFLRNVREYQGIELQNVGDYEANLVDVLMEGKEVPQELRQNIKNLFLAGDVNIGQGRDIIDLLNDLPNKANTRTTPRKSTTPKTNAAPELIVGPQDDPDKIKDPNLIMQDVRRNHPNYVVLKNGDLVISSREDNGKRYEVIVRRTQQERFFAYIREVDIATGATRVVKVGNETHSYKALISQLNKAKGAIQSNDVARHMREHHAKRFIAIPDNADMSGFEPLGDVIQDFISGANLPENKREIAALARDLLNAGFDRLFQIDPAVLDHVLNFARENDLSPEFINGLMDNVRLNKVREAGILHLRNVLDNPTHQDANGVELKEGDIVDWPQWDPNEPGYGRVFRGRVHRVKYAQVGGGGNVDYVYSDYLVVISEEYNRFRGDKKPKSRQRDRVAANLVKVNEGDPITPFFEPKVKEAREQEDILTPAKMGVPENPPAGEAPRTIKRPTSERPINKTADIVTDPNGDNYVAAGDSDTHPALLAIADQAELDRIAAPLKAQQPENVNEYQPGDLLPVWDDNENRMRYDQILAVEVQPDGSVKITKLILKPMDEGHVIRDIILHPNQLMPLLRPPVQDRFSGSSGGNIAKTPEGYAFFDNGEEKLYLPEYATMNTIGKVSGRWEIIPDENGKYVGEIVDEDGRVIMSNRYSSPSVARDAIALEIRLRNERRRAEDEAAKNKEVIAPEGYVLQENSGEAFLVPEDKNGVQSKKYVMRWDKGTGGVPVNLEIQDRNGNTVGWAEAFSVEEAQNIINEWLNDSRNVMTPEPVASEVVAPDVALGDLIGVDNKSRQEWLDNAPVGALIEFKINNSVFKFMKRPSGRWSTYIDEMKRFFASNVTYKADYFAGRDDVRYAGQVPSDFNLGSVNAAQDLNNGQSIPDLNWMKNAPVGAVIFNARFGDKFVKLNDGSWAVLEFNASGPHHDGVVPEEIWDFYGKDLVFGGAAPEGYDLGRNDKAPSVKEAPKFVPSIFQNPDAPWRKQPATQRQKDRIKKLLQTKKVGITTGDRIRQALQDPNITKGELSDIINELNNARDLTLKPASLDEVLNDSRRVAEDVTWGPVSVDIADEILSVANQSEKLESDPNIADAPPTDAFGGEPVKKIAFDDIKFGNRNAPFDNVRVRVTDAKVGDLFPYGRGDKRVYYQFLGYGKVPPGAFGGPRPRWRIIAGPHNDQWLQGKDGQITHFYPGNWEVANVKRPNANAKNYFNENYVEPSTPPRPPRQPGEAFEVGDRWVYDSPDEKIENADMPENANPDIVARGKELAEQHFNGEPVVDAVLGGGAMNDGAYFAKTKDGKIYFVKRVRPRFDEYNKEILVNRMFLALGVEEIVCVGGGDGAIVLMEKVDGKRASDSPLRQGIEQNIPDYPTAKIMGIIDIIANNSDRHGGNWMINTDGNPVPIDNGFCWFDDEDDEYGEDGGPFARFVIDDAQNSRKLFTKLELYEIREKLKNALANLAHLDPNGTRVPYVLRRIDDLIRMYGY